MQIRMQVVNGSLVVRPEGELTEDAASELLAEIEKQLAPVPRDVILSMAGVESMAVGALPYIFRIQKQTQSAENRFVVAGAPPTAMRLFEHTNVAGSLALAPSELDALREPVA